MSTQTEAARLRSDWRRVDEKATAAHAAIARLLDARRQTITKAAIRAALENAGMAFAELEQLASAHITEPVGPAPDVQTALVDALDGLRKALAAFPFKETVFLTRNEQFMAAYRDMNAALKLAGRGTP